MFSFSVFNLMLVLRCRYVSFCWRTGQVIGLWWWWVFDGIDCVIWLSGRNVSANWEIDLLWLCGCTSFSLEHRNTVRGVFYNFSVSVQRAGCLQLQPVWWGHWSIMGTFSLDVAVFYRGWETVAEATAGLLCTGPWCWTVVWTVWRAARLGGAPRCVLLLLQATTSMTLCLLNCLTTTTT